MMTSKRAEYTLCSLLFTTTANYEENLQTLLALITTTEKNTLIVSPEVCLTGFDYDNLEDALAFASKATEALKKASRGKIIVLTMLEKIDNEVFNVAKIFYNEKVVFSRAKARLFRFGDEHKYMNEGDDKACKIVEVDGIKIAIFICFELRFKELWIQAEGADVIVVPSWWGKARSEHFRVITQTLAIINQCYLVASDSQNEECTQLSGIITPQGIVQYNDGKALLKREYKKKEIQLMRRYLDVGMDNEKSISC